MNPLATAPQLERKPPGPAIKQLHRFESFIILGKGPSRKRYGEIREQLESTTGTGPALLTLNNFFPKGTDPEMEGFDLPSATHLHFDVHYDQRFWPLLRELDCPCIVSPFRGADIPSGANWEAFPLAYIKYSGYRAYIESTLDYMLATIFLAHHRTGQRLHGKTIALPGCDMQDPTHFAYRFGMHYWIGLLAGRGARFIIPPESAALKRYAGRRCTDTEPDFPHIYGQPWDCTEPYAKEYGWE